MKLMEVAETYGQTVAKQMANRKPSEQGPASAPDSDSGVFQAQSPNLRESSIQYWEGYVLQLL